MKKTSKRIINDQILSDMDCKILMFLWRWKVATSLTLREHAASQKNFWNFYHRLRTLCDQDYIEVRAGGIREKYLLWQLTEKSFEYMREDLGLLEDVGFRPAYPYHDCVVNAFHLGHWLFAKPKEIELFTERELKAYFKEHYPSWVPQTKSHRPDGYTLVRNANRNRVLAIEVEISQKGSENYEMLCDFYDEKESIEHVLWLVRGKTMMNAILRAFDCRQWKRKNCHLFFDLADFTKNAWDAKILHGQKTGTSLAELYHQLGANIPTNLPITKSTFDPILTFLKPIQSPRGLQT